MSEPMRPEAPRVPPELQELAEDFEILGEVGRGATAVVYKARERALDRLVAIKVIRARHLADDEAVQRLEREARLVARFNHPNVVSLHAVRRLRHDSLALVMRYVHGETLRSELRRRGPLPAARVRRLAADVARALAAAHAYGVVHRDVKPEKVYVEHPAGRALLADFGAAAPLDAAARLTATGITIGTPGYLAPELVDGADATPLSDIYSLGLVAWEALTGVQPWSGVTLFEVLAFRKHGALPPLSTLVSDVPAGLAVAIERSLEADPARRWPDANSMLTALVAPEVPKRGTMRSRLASWREGGAGDASRPAAPGGVGGGLAAGTAPTAQAADGDLPTIALSQRPDLQAPPFAPTSVRAAAPRDPAAPPGPAPAPSAAPGTPPSAAHATPPVAAAAATGTGAAAADVPVPGPDQQAWRARQRRGPRARGSRALAVSLLMAVVAIVAWVVLGSGREEDAGGFDVVESGSDARRSIPVEVERSGTVELEAPPGAADAGGAAGDADAGEITAVPEATTSPVPLDGRPPAAAGTVARVPSGPAGSRVVVPPPAPTPPAAAAASEAAPARTGTAPSPAPSPSAAPALAFDNRFVAAGGMHSCSVSRAGTLFCWGGNDRGQLGSGGPRLLAATAVELPGRASRVALGLLHSCAVTAGEIVVCWGANDRGQLGDGTNDARSAAEGVPGLAGAGAVAVGAAHSCALQSSGRALCWGANDQGQLGIGHRRDREAPAFVTGGLRFASLVTGWNHSCALEPDGTAMCWGAGRDGQLGDGGSTSRSAPVPVAGDHRFRALAAGRSHTCGATTSGEVLCWGDNEAGQSGGDRRRVDEPSAVAGVSGAIRVVAGSLHSCALTGAGETICWGQNRYGQLGDGTTDDSAAPRRVQGAPAFVEIGASAAHTCGVTRGGDVYCWGYNLEGQLGDGSRSNRTRAVRVRPPGS